MGASNFTKTNASNYFVVLTNQEIQTKVCQDCEEIHRDWEYDLDTLNECQSCGHDILSEEIETEEIDLDDIENQKDCTIERLKENPLYKKWYGYSVNKCDMDRNYPCTNFFEMQKSKNFGDVEFTFEITMQLVAGYYEGATLDWEYDVMINGYEIDEDRVEEEFLDTTEMNAGLKAMQAKNIVKWVEKTKAEAIEMVEKAFKESSEEYGRLATFSNGESIYKKVENQ
jgi:hypothetical protein